jgi:coenzyme F420 hydrogenase subunit beta
MEYSGPHELLSEVIQQDLCIGCGACIDICPYFKSYRGTTVMLFSCTLAEGKCFAYCPKVELDLDQLSRQFFDAPYGADPLGHYRFIYISRAGKKMAGSPFQAGGTVSAIMSFALQKGYLDGAVLTGRERLLPVPCLVTDPGGVLKCTTSKYTAAPTVSALNKAIHDGYTKVGVVVTPCQAHAVALIRSQGFNDGDCTDPVRLVVGLFCTWSLDFRSFEDFMKQNIPVEHIEKVDIPPPPAEIMEIYSTDGEKLEVPLDEIRQLVPESCSYCFDMTAEFSDISVGVLEGRPDMNTLIIRTERGRKLVTEAVDEGYLTVDEIPEDALKHLTWAAGRKKERGLVKTRDEGMIHTADRDRKSMIRLRDEILTRITAPQSRR